MGGDITTQTPGKTVYNAVENYIQIYLPAVNFSRIWLIKCQ